MSIFITERQRIEALEICDRIEALNVKIQGHAKAALDILERASAPKPPRTKYVHDALTHRVIASRPVAQTNPFCGDWITEAIASAFEVRPDDVRCIETFDGEFYVIKGERVAYVETN